MNNKYKEICEILYSLSIDKSHDSIEKISSFLIQKNHDTYDKHAIPYFACQALINKGAIGIDKMMELLDRIDSSINYNAIIKTVWATSQNKSPSLLFASPCPQFNKILDENIISYAKEAFFNFIIKSHSDPETFSRLIHFMYMEMMQTSSDKDDYIEFHKNIFSILTDTSIQISDKILNDFRKLINKNENEETYQQFFEQYPVLINPLAMFIIDKHKLGTEYITDFIVKTLESNYILVEIEKPQDKIFTQSGDFTSKFSHAFGQVLDFIDWIESNISYAQKNLPNISAPKGLLIMGRNIDLNLQTRKKLQRFNRNSSSIEVLTYDDIFLKAQSLYKNIKKKIEIKT